LLARDDRLLREHRTGEGEENRRHKICIANLQAEFARDFIYPDDSGRR
jgi:hypothetical protein